MKKLIFSLLSLCLFNLAASAQTKAVQTVKIATPTVQCEMCKKRIETYFKRYDGIEFINVNVKKNETTLKYIKDRIK